MAKSLRILFLRPRPSPRTIGLQHLMVVEPLELEVLAAVTGPEDIVRITDMILESGPVEQFIREFRPDVLCVTGYITHIPEMIRCCGIAKSIRPGVVTVAGGVHLERCPEACPDGAVDYRIVRNATRAFPALLDLLRNGKEGPLPPGVLRSFERVAEVDLPPFDFYYPFPRRDLTARYRKHYFYVFHDKVALLKTSFGCPYDCSFCFCRKITGGHYHERPLDEVMQELEMIREKEVYIVDDIFLCSPRRVSDFIDELRRRKIDKRFLVYGRADFIESHPAIIRNFRAAGLRTVIVGLESFSDCELKAFRKEIISKTNQDAMKILRWSHVDCYAAIILSPCWNEGDFSALSRELRDLGIRFVNLQPLTPLPGSDLTAAETDLVVSRGDFDLWDLAHVILNPQKMSVPEYYRLIIRTYRRAIFRWSNLGVWMRYPLYLQWRLAKGIVRINRQYVSIMKESMQHA